MVLQPSQDRSGGRLGRLRDGVCPAGGELVPAPDRGRAGAPVHAGGVPRAYPDRAALGRWAAHTPPGRRPARLLGTHGRMPRLVRRPTLADPTTEADPNAGERAAGVPSLDRRSRRLGRSAAAPRRPAPGGWAEGGRWEALNLPEDVDPYIRGAPRRHEPAFGEPEQLLAWLAQVGAAPARPIPRSARASPPSPAPWPLPEHEPTRPARSA